MCTFLTCIEMKKYFPSHMFINNSHDDPLILLHTLGFKKATKAENVNGTYDLQI